MANQIQGDAASLAANARAQFMLQEMQNAIAQQNTALDHALAQPAPKGAALSAVWNNVKLLDKQISTLRRVLPAIGQNADVLAPINSAMHALEGRFAPVRVLEIGNGTHKTRHSGIHNKIMSFAGPFGRTINVICCNEIPSAEKRPIVLTTRFPGFERLALDCEFDRCRSDYNMFILHGFPTRFLCMATEQDPLVFDAREAILTCSNQELLKTAQLMIAERTIQVFHHRTRKFDFSLLAREKEGADHWSNLFQGEAGEFAKKIMMRHVWLLEGCIDNQGNPVSLEKDRVSRLQFDSVAQNLTYENTVGKFNHPVYVALYRLARNGLRLLRTQPERNAVAVFAKSLENPSTHNKESLQVAYDRLKIESKDAAKLLAFIFGHRASTCSDDWERILLEANTPERIKRIQGIADLLALSENGRVYQLAKTVLPGVKCDLGIGLGSEDEFYDGKDPVSEPSEPSDCKSNH